MLGIFFSLLLSYTFGSSSGGVCLHTRTDYKLFNLARLHAKTKIRQVVIRKMLFGDDAALILLTEEGLQRLMDQLAQACTEFGLTMNLKKTKVMGQEVSEAPAISTDDHTLEVVEEFTYMFPTITSNLSLNVEINKRIGKAATIMSRLSKRVWEYTRLVS